MNDMETRLSAALRARADMVQADDIGAPVLPTAAPGPWRHRTGTLVAVVVLVLLAVPLIVFGMRGSTADRLDPAQAPSEAPEPSEPATEVAPEDPAEGSAEGPQLRRADVDGDGEEDEIVWSRDHDGDGSVIVTYADGGAAFWTPEDPSMGLMLASPVDVDPAVGGAEVLVQVGADPASLVVLGHSGEETMDVLLGPDSEVNAGSDAAGRAHRWWQHEEGIRSTASVERIVADFYEVVVTDHRFNGEGAVAVPMGTYCVTAGQPETLRDCEEGGSD